MVAKPDPHRIDWERFLADHLELVRRTGLSALILESQDHFDDFLKHGYLDAVEDPEDFTVEDLAVHEYAALRELVDRYFESDTVFFVPVALKRDDYMALAERHAGTKMPPMD